MVRKSILIEGLTLSYIEQNPTETFTIFMFHGNSNSARLWQKQMIDPRLSNYRIIAFDLPAHGLSSGANPHIVYNVVTMGRIMAAAVIYLKIKNNYALVGLSLGGNVVVEMLNYAIKPNALILVCPSLVGAGIIPSDVIKDSLTAQVLFNDEVELALVKKYLLKASISLNEQDQEFLLEDYSLVQPDFRSSFAKSIAAGSYTDEVALVKSQGLPLLVIWGENDEITLPDLLEKVNLNLWGNKVHKIKNAGHLVNLDQPELFNIILIEFLSTSLNNAMLKRVFI